VKRIFTIIIVFSSLLSIGQVSKPIVKNYTPKDYNAFFQNWGACQDKKGTMYFANNYGILTYNGTSWGLISTKSQALIRCVKTLPNDKIIAAGYNQIGYVESDSIGNSHFISFSDDLVDSGLSFGNVWDILPMADGSLYFSTDAGILNYSDKKLKRVFSDSHQFFKKVNNKIYTTDFENGLVEFVNDTIMQIPNGDFFKGKRIYSAVPLKGGLMVITKNDGIYHYSKDTIIELGNEQAKQLFKKSRLYTAIKLPNGNICVGTLKNGAIIINEVGDIVEIINKSSGIQNENCWGLFSDKQGNLWMMLDKGISKIEYNCPISIYGAKDNIEGTIMKITEYNNKLYLATSVGLYQGVYEETGYGNELKFTLHPDINSQCWDLEKSNGYLLVASSSGLFSLDKLGITKPICNDVTYSIKKSNSYSNLIYVGKQDVFSLVVFNNTNFKEQEIDSLNFQVRSIYEESENIVWLGTYVNGAVRLSYTLKSDFSIEEYKFKSYSYNEGLEGNEIDVFSYQNDIVFSTDIGLMKKNENDSGIQFYADSTLGESFCNSSRIVYRLKEDYKNNVWIYAPITGNSSKLNTLGFVKIHKKKPIWISENFNRITEGDIYSFYPLTNGDVWFGGVEGLMKYHNKRISVGSSNIFYTLLSSITTITDDSIVYKDNTLGGFKLNKIPEFNYDLNSMQFEFTCTSYLNEDENEFQYQLVGFDKDWSSWSKDTKKQYTNLYEGTYTFTVRSKNIYDNQGIESSYSFTILPPWYRTWYAYLALISIIVFVIVVIVRLSVFRLKLANDRLEGIVKERTQEITEKNFQLNEVLIGIRDSISYAKRLQDAILPKKNEIDKLFKESFIFFKPRDIVSGDFYWAAKKKNHKIFIVADCTGHGVPGAFVSMLGYNLLNQIVLEKGIVDCSEILNRLNIGVQGALKNEQSINNSNDGMDISICSISNENKLFFAGAHRPLLIVRNNELFELKGDKRAIGGRTELDYSFKNHEFQLQKGDMLYMFSDGYADQFGGLNGKKFLTKKLKELLRSTAVKSTHEQKKIIENSFNKWKGNLDQLDDVLLVGIKVEI